MSHPLVSHAICNDVLSSIAQVDFSSMQYCYDSPSEVPKLLRDYLVGQQPASEKAETKLFNNLCYQGSIFEPTSHVIRALVIALPHVPNGSPRRELVDSLAYLITGNAFSEGSGALLFLREDDPDREAILAQYEREKIWVQEVRIASWQAYSVYRDWLEHNDDEALVVMLAYALSSLLTRAADGIPPSLNLDQEIRSTSLALDLCSKRCSLDAARASCLMALGALAESAAGNLILLDEGLNAEGPLARAWSAVALSQVAAPPALAAKRLCEALARHLEHAAWLPKRWPWSMGHLRFTLIHALCSSQFDDVCFASCLPAVNGILRTTMSPWTFELEGYPVLRRALGERQLTSSTRRKDLDLISLSVLDAIFDNPLMFPNTSGNMSNALRTFGLENKQPFWERLLERKYVGTGDPHPLPPFPDPEDDD